MKCQILCSGKNKKNIINLPSAENAQRVVKVKCDILCPFLTLKMRSCSSKPYKTFPHQLMSSCKFNKEFPFSSKDRLWISYVLANTWAQLFKASLA